MIRLQQKRFHLALTLLVASLPVMVTAQNRPAPRPQNAKKITVKAQATVTTQTTVTRPRTAGGYQYGVKPNWIDGERFWYRHDTAAGRRSFLIIDPSAGTRQPAFDHARLATALSKTLGRTVTEADLPVDSIAFDADGKLRVQVGEKTFAVANDGSLSPSDALLGRASRIAPGTGAFRSRDGGGGTDLTFVNRTENEVDLFWVAGDGTRRQYGSLRVGEERKQHTFSGHLWLAARKDGVPIALFYGGDMPQLAVVENTPPVVGSLPQSRPDPFVSPDGKWQVTARGYNLFLKEVAASKEIALTTSGTKDDAYDSPPYWSPDSRHLIAFQTVPAQEHKVYLVESSPADQVQPKLHVNDYLKPGDRIAHPRPRLFDVVAARQIPVSEELFPNPWDIDRTTWEPDGKRFTFLYNQRGHQVVRLIGLNADTGAAQTIIEETSPTFIDYSGKTFLQQMPKTHEAIWASERSGWNHLYLYDTQKATATPITKGDWLVRGVDRVDEDKRQLWFRAAGIVPGQDPYYVHFCRVNFDGTGLTVLTEGDGTHSVEYSPNGKYLVDTYSRVDLPPTANVRRVDNGKRTLALEAGQLEPGANVPNRFVSKARDGKTDIYGIVVRPSNFDPKKKYPVLEQIYAGPQSAFVPKSWGQSGGLQAMADLGFIVVQIDGMGTNWRSKAFHDVCWKNLADGGFPDRVPWIKAAAHTRPYMDLTRVGIYGGSAGGQNALGGLLLHGDFYKAAVADCGCHDNRIDKIWWNEQWMGWPVGPEYAASSNVTLAPRLTGQLLLIVGELDENVDPASTMQVVNALIKADKDFDLLVMPGVGHGAAGTPYGRRRQQDFFIRTLQGVAPPKRTSGVIP